jgi:Flp pilus assembly protein TadG
MRQRLKTLGRDNAGSSLIELALSMTVLLALLAGIADLALYIYASVEATNAAHAGALYGAQNPVTACDNAGMVAAAKADAPNIVNITATATGANSNCKASAICACSNSLGTFAACSTISCSGAGNRVLEYVQVNTTATVSTIVRFPGMPASLTLNGQNIMRVEQ